MDSPPSGEELVRMRREFEAARSFEESDDVKYAFRPSIELLPQTATIIPTANPRLAALQSLGNQRRESETPRPRKKSLPQQYNPGTHGAWRPSEPIVASLNKHASLADAKRVQQRLGQFAQDAGKPAMSHGYTTRKSPNDHFEQGYIAEDDWMNISADMRKEIYFQRSQLQEHVASRQLALASFVPAGPRSDIAVAHSRNNSDGSRSSESVASGQAVEPQLTGGQWSRNGMVWRATYGGNFTGGA